MHELAITENIVKITNDEMKKQDNKKAISINIKVGILSDLVPECIQMYFDLLSKDTYVEGAKLNIEKLEADIKCNQCKKEFKSSKSIFNCPFCGSRKISINGGNEFYIDNMEVD